MSVLQNDMQQKRQLQKKCKEAAIFSLNNNNINVDTHFETKRYEIQIKIEH